VKKILEATGGTGVDVLLGMSGNATAIQQGSKRCAQAGARPCWGSRRRTCRLDLVNDVIFKGATVQGIYGRTYVPDLGADDCFAESVGCVVILSPLFGERVALENLRKLLRNCRAL